jgi:uncharacterized coiled-coil protein SlyX
VRYYKHSISSLRRPVYRGFGSDNAGGKSNLGLIAEDVATVNPDLVARDEEGKIVTVRYQAVNAMLLNEFLKEHKKVEEQEKTIVELKSGMIALAATVKEQAAQIQKVSDQLEATKPAPQVLNSDVEFRRNLASLSEKLNARVDDRSLL